MLPDRVSNPGPLTYESGALPIALRGPACMDGMNILILQLFSASAVVHRMVIFFLVSPLEQATYNTTCILTLKAPITTAADDIHKSFSLFFRENKTCFK